MSSYFALASGAGGVAGLGIFTFAADTTSRAGLAITSCVLALYFVILLSLILRGYFARVKQSHQAVVAARPTPRHLASDRRARDTRQPPDLFGHVD
jgi:hypothetical protein